MDTKETTKMFINSHDEKLKHELLQKAKDNLFVNIELYAADPSDKNCFIVISDGVTRWEVQIKNYPAFTQLIRSEIEYRNILIDGFLNEIGKL